MKMIKCTLYILLSITCIYSAQNSIPTRSNYALGIHFKVLPKEIDDYIRFLFKNLINKENQKSLYDIEKYLVSQTRENKNLVNCKISKEDTLRYQACASPDIRIAIMKKSSFIINVTKTTPHGSFSGSLNIYDDKNKDQCLLTFHCQKHILALNMEDNILIAYYNNDSSISNGSMATDSWDLKKGKTIISSLNSFGFALLYKCVNAKDLETFSALCNSYTHFLLSIKGLQDTEK